MSATDKQKIAKLLSENARLSGWIIFLVVAGVFGALTVVRIFFTSP
jgi:hypothetical protein